MRSPLDDKLGIEVVDFDPDRLVATMPVAGNEQPFGLLHGGATCALVETIGSVAAAVGAGPGKQVVGIELNASYLRAATSGTVRSRWSCIGTSWLGHVVRGSSGTSWKASRSTESGSSG